MWVFSTIFRINCNSDRVSDFNRLRMDLQKTDKNELITETYRKSPDLTSGCGCVVSKYRSLLTKALAASDSDVALQCLPVYAHLIVNLNLRKNETNSHELAV